MAKQQAGRGSGNSASGGWPLVLLYSIGMGLIAAIDVLQAYRVNAGAVTDYGRDIVGPAFWYLLLRTSRGVPGYRLKKPLTPEITAVSVFTLCLAWELSQRFDLSATPLAIARGWYDPLDIVAYGVALMLCYTIDKTMQFRRHDLE